MKTFLRLAALLLFANVCAMSQGVPIPGTPATLGNAGILSDNTYIAGSTTTAPISIAQGQFAGMNYFKVEFGPLSGSNITTCNVYIDTSIDGVTWTQGGAISGQNCSPEGSATNGPTAANYVRVDIFVAGQGQARVRLIGGMSSLAGGGGGGGVSSVGLSLPSGLFSVTGSPVTGSGTLAATFQTISPHLYLGNNTSSPATAALVQPSFADLTGQATTAQLPFTYTSTNSSTVLVTAGATFTGTSGNGVCLDNNLNLVTSGCTGSMVYPSGNGIPIVVSGNSWGTTVAAPTGTVVGTSDTQTLTNKSIAGSEINSGTVAAARLPAALANSTSINGLNITASTGTLTISGSKTLTISNSLTLAGTDGTTQTFPSTSGTVITSVSTAGGDLSGTYPNPVVAQVNGAVVPVSKTIVGTNGSGAIVDASSATLANNTTGSAASGASGFTIAGLADGCLHTVSNVVQSTGSSCGSGGGMIYPSGSGIPIVVSGTSWGTTVAQPTGAIVGAGQANTYTTGLQSFASATMSLPSAASYAPTTAGLFGYDSTNNRAVLGNGTNTSFLTWITAAPVTLDLTEFSGTLGALTDTGILTANVVTQTSNGANHQICAYTTTNKVCVPTTTLPTAAEPAHTGDATNAAGSLAMTVVAINGTTFSGTTNDVVAFGAGNTPLDSGVLYTNLTTQTSNGAANQVCNYTGANKTCVPGTVPNAALANSTIGISGASNQITSSTATPALGGSTTLAIANPFTFPGKFTTVASASGAASMNMPSGSAPTSPVSGDLWNLSGIVQFYDGTHTNSMATIQAAVTSGHCPQFSGTAGLMTDSGSICPSISGLAATQVVVASSSTAITSYAGFTSDSSGNVTAASLTISNPNPGISYFGQGTTPWATGTTSVGLTAPTTVSTSYNLVFPSSASAGTNASSGNFYMKLATSQNQTGCTASPTELCGYFESNIDLTTDVGSTILPASNGGTGNAFVAFTGPATSVKTFTLPNASATILTNNAAVTVGQGGTGTNTLTAHAPVLGNGTGIVNTVGPGATGAPLIGQGSSADPIFGNSVNLGLSGTAGTAVFGNATSGTVTLGTVAGALGSVTASLPANTGTIMETNLAQTLSALQTFGTNISIGGVTATGATGTGNVVFSASPSLTGTVAIGASGSLGALAFGNATSGLLTLETATGAITSYTLQLPIAQPSGSNTFLSCTAANPAVCTWVAGGGGGTPAYPITITGGVSGGVVYGSSSTQLTVSAAGTTNTLMKWGGAGAAPGISSITDNGTIIIATEAFTNIQINTDSSLGTNAGSGLYIPGTSLTAGDVYYQASGGLTLADACSFPAFNVTFSNGSAVITGTNTLNVGCALTFTTTGGLPTNFATATTYFVIATGLTSGQFEVAATIGGSAISAGSAGSGTQTTNGVNQAPAICLAVSTTQCMYSGTYRYSASQSWTAGQILYLSDFLGGYIAANYGATVLGTGYTGTAGFTNSSAVITITNTLAAGNQVVFTTTNTLPTNFSPSVVYYVIAAGLSGTQFEVSATPGGSAITAGSAGTGTQSVTLVQVPAPSGRYLQRVGVALASDTIQFMPSIDVGTIQ